jgi:GT2 family glycosyltransferase
MNTKDDPLVTITVLNYRRRDELSRVLESIRIQTYKNREVIVVDNGSGDGTGEYICGKFPEIKLIALSENSGCAGRNRGVEAAAGEIVVMLDNDVSFDRPTELETIVRRFAELRCKTVLVFRILRHQTGRLSLRDWCHPKSINSHANTEFETYYIAEGACAFRRQEYLHLGGYYEPFLIGGEGWDLALRVIDADMRILYCPDIQVRHSMAEATRSARKPYYYYTRNSIWTAYKDYSGWRRWTFLLYSFAKMLFFCTRPSRVKDVISGTIDGFSNLSELQQTILSRQAWQRLKDLSSGRPSWFTRLRTHWHQPEI